MPRALAGLLAGVVLAIAGALTAVPAVLLHQRWWGLALGLVAPIAFLAAAPAGWPRVGYALGWATGVGLLSGTRPAGDYLLPAALPGYLLLAATAAYVVVALVTLPARAPREDPGPAGSGT